MRAVITRVKSASVSIAGSVVGEIGHGLLILLGVLCLAKDDKDDEAGDAEAAPVRAGE